MNVAKDESIYIEKVNDERNRYLFKNGRLVLFCTGKGADIFRITYGNKGIPQSIYNVSKNLKEIEFAYNKEEFLTKIVFPENKKTLFITYGKCDILSEDGTTKQGGLLKSISSITFADGKKEEYRYSAEAKKKNRNILTKNGTEKTHANVPINKFEQKIGEDDKGFIEWDATTGIIVSDSGGEYAVRNPIFDKHNPEYTDVIFISDRKRKIKTKESRISYKRPEYKYEEVWDYNLRNAIKVIQNPHTGEQTRISYIGTPGTASMKVRKIEKKFITDETWQLSVIHTYDCLGRKIRSVSSNGITEYKFEGDDKYEFLNSQLIRSENFDKRTKKITIKIYKDTNTILEFIYGTYPNFSLLHKENGKFVYYKEYNDKWDESTISYKELSDGTKFIYQYVNKARESLEISSGGFRQLTKYNPKKKQYESITDKNSINKWYEKINNRNYVIDNIN